MGVLSPKQTGSGPLVCVALQAGAHLTSVVPATPSRPRARGQKISSCRARDGGVGRMGLEGAAPVNEVRRLAKVGESSKPRLGWGQFLWVCKSPSWIISVDRSLWRSFSTSFCFPWVTSTHGFLPGLIDFFFFFFQERTCLSPSFKKKKKKTSYILHLLLISQSGQLSIPCAFLRYKIVVW